MLVVIQIALGWLLVVDSPNGWVLFNLNISRPLMSKHKYQNVPKLCACLHPKKQPQMWILQTSP